MTTPDFLPPHLLERLGGLDLIARRIVDGFVAGGHRARRLGAGEEFTRHREYRPGDDLRALDWRLYGRTDRLYLREYRADSNLQAYLILDATLSMGYADAAGVAKLRYATYLAAALAHLMLRAGDQVGLASYGATARLHLPPRNRPGYLPELLRVLERLEPAGHLGAAAALDRVGESLRRRGRVIVISDLLEEDDGAALIGAAGRLRSRGDEVIVLRPLTPAESGEAAPGAARFFDPERPDHPVDAVPADDPGYAARVGAYYDRLHMALRDQGAEFVPVSTSTPVELALGEWLGRRGETRGEIL